jgi:hypothetical protein
MLIRIFRCMRRGREGRDGRWIDGGVEGVGIGRGLRLFVLFGGVERGVRAVAVVVAIAAGVVVGHVCGGLLTMFSQSAE